MTEKQRVIVVGAGIAGLTAAFRLKQAGKDVTVLERSTKEFVGGRMSTIVRDGFPIDLAATLLTTQYKEMLTLIADAGLASEIVISTNAVIGFLREGQIDRIDAQSLFTILISKYVRAFPKVDLFKLAMDFKRVSRDFNANDMSGMATHDFENLRQYATRRGIRPETMEYFLDPLTR